MRKIRPLLVVIVLAVLVVPNAGWAASGSGDGSVGQLFRWFDAVWTAVWGDNGICVDPFGQCGAAPTTQGGCSIDPDGNCTAGERAANGICVDPLGEHSENGAAGEMPNTGVCVDPYGRPTSCQGAS